MKLTPEKLKETMQGKTNEELFGILASHSWDHRPETIEAASAEYKHRQLKIPDLFEFAAALENVETVGKWNTVRVSRKSYKFPQTCPDCLGGGPFTVLSLSSDEEKLKGFYLIVRHYEYLKVNVPFCMKCGARQLKRSRVGLLLFILGLIISIVTGDWLDLSRLQGFLLTVTLCGAPLWLRGYWGRTVRVAKYDDDSVTFSFRRREYAEEFKKINRTDLRTLMSGA